MSEQQRREQYERNTYISIHGHDTGFVPSGDTLTCQACGERVRPNSYGVCPACGRGLRRHRPDPAGTYGPNGGPFRLNGCTCTRLVGSAGAHAAGCPWGRRR